MKLSSIQKLKKLENRLIGPLRIRKLKYTQEVIEEGLKLNREVNL